MSTEQESISALCFSLSKDSQISSVLAPKGGSMITTSFSLLIRKFWRTASAFSPWKAWELKKLNQINFSGGWNAWQERKYAWSNPILPSSRRDSYQNVPAILDQGPEAEIWLLQEESQRQRDTQRRVHQWSQALKLSRGRIQRLPMKKSAALLFCLWPAKIICKTMEQKAEY